MFRLQRHVVLLFALSLVFNGCQRHSLRNSLNELESLFRVSNSSDTTAWHALGELRSQIIHENDIELDSLYNSLVLRAFEATMKDGPDVLQHIAFITGASTSVSLPSISQAHGLRYWGSHKPARSIFTSLAMEDEHSHDLLLKANLWGNLAMEYADLGFLPDARRCAEIADSCFMVSADYSSRMWSQRLLYDINVRSRNIAAAMENLDLYRASRLVATRRKQWEMSDTITDYHFIESVYANKRGKEDLVRAFGHEADSMAYLYQELESKYASSVSNYWIGSKDRTFRLPKPVIRTVRRTQRNLAWTDSISATKVDGIIYHTPFGSYKAIGDYLYLYDVQTGPQNNFLTSQLSRESVETVFKSTGTIKRVSPRAGGGLYIITADSAYRLLSKKLEGYDLSRLHSRNTDIVDVLSLKNDRILLLTRGSVQLIDATGEWRIISEINTSETNLSRAGVTTRNDRTQLSCYNDSLILIRWGNSNTASFLKLNNLRLLPMNSVGRIVSFPTGPKGVFDGVSLSMMPCSAGDGDSLYISSTHRIAYDRHYGTLAKTNLRQLPAPTPFIVIADHDNIDILDTAKRISYPQYAAPIPAVFMNVATAGTYISDDGMLRGYYSDGKTVYDFRLQSNASEQKPPLYCADESVFRGTHSLTSLKLVDSSLHLVAGHDYGIASSSTALTLDYPLYYKLERHQHWFPDNEQQRPHNSITVTAGYSDSYLLVNTGEPDGAIRINIINPFWTTPWFRIASGALIVGVLLISSLAFFRFQKIRQQQRIEDAKAQQLELLREDMHDMIGSRLVRIASLTRQASPENSEEVLSRIHDMTLVTVRSLRNLLTLMSERAMTDAQFYGSIREYIMESCRDAGIAANIDVDIDDDRRTTLDNSGRHELLMIVSEMMTNTVRHAQATKVRLRVVVSDHNTLLQWSDNGIGLDSDAQRGNGLNNIQRRASRINATVNLESAPDLGTRYTLTFPIRRESQQ